MRFFSILICLSIVMPMSASVVADTHDDRRLQDEKLQQPTTPQPAMAGTLTPTTTNENPQIHLNAEQLLSQPTLLQHALLSALTYHHVENSVYLFEYYQQLAPELQNPFLVTWAKAVKAEYHDDYPQAIQSYQQLLQTYPHYDLFRLRYAMVLTKQGYRKEAMQQFNQLLNKENVPSALQKVAHDALTYLKAAQRWKWSTDANYIRDNNLNNAPQNRHINQNLTAQESQSAQGIQLALATQKINQLKHGTFQDFRFATHAKYYWNQQHYNDLSGRISLGLGKIFPQSSFVVLPFFEKNWYAGGTPQQHQLKPFSHSQGVSLEFKTQFSPKWHGAVHAEYAKNQYRTRTHLNGFAQTLAASTTYLANPQRYYRIGTEYQRIKSQDADDGFQRIGIRFGLGQQWQSGLNTYLSASYAQRHYQGAMPIFNLVQRNHDYGLTASLGHQQLQWRGIQPRLTWQYHKVDSNITLYDYDKQRVFIELTKQF